MWKRFYPDETAESVRDIDYRAYLEQGVRGIIFDIDNTLVPQDAPIPFEYDAGKVCFTVPEVLLHQMVCVE